MSETRDDTWAPAQKICPRTLAAVCEFVEIKAEALKAELAKSGDQLSNKQRTRTKGMIQAAEWIGRDIKTGALGGQLQDNETMIKLSKRLETESPSRELDAEIARALLQQEAWQDSANPDLWWLPVDVLPEFCTSYDAVIALFHQMLPGWSYEFRVSGYGLAQANLWEPDKGPPMICPENQHRAERKNGYPPMALMAAVCRARGL